jgi:hypothetical protein
MRWNAVSGGSKCATAASAVARTPNGYLLRYGRAVAYYQWWEQDTARQQQLLERASKLDRARWRALRRQTAVVQHEQLTRFRIRHKPQAFLASLEQRWTAAAPTPLLP